MDSNIPRLIIAQMGSGKTRLTLGAQGWEERDGIHMWFNMFHSHKFHDVINYTPYTDFDPMRFVEVAMKFEDITFLINNFSREALKEAVKLFKVMIFTYEGEDRFKARMKSRGDEDLAKLIDFNAKQKRLKELFSSVKDSSNVEFVVSNEFLSDELTRRYL